MIRRLFWLGLGLAGGFLAAVWGLAGVRRARSQLTPSAARQHVDGRLRAGAGSMREAVVDGRRAKRRYEAETMERLGLAGARVSDLGR